MRLYFVCTLQYASNLTAPSTDPIALLTSSTLLWRSRSLVCQSVFLYVQLGLFTHFRLWSLPLWLSVLLILPRRRLLSRSLALSNRLPVWRSSVQISKWRPVMFQRSALTTQDRYPNQEQTFASRTLHRRRRRCRRSHAYSLSRRLPKSQGSRCHR